MINAYYKREWLTFTVSDKAFYCKLYNVKPLITRTPYYAVFEGQIFHLDISAILKPIWSTFVTSNVVLIDNIALRSK